MSNDLNDVSISYRYPLLSEKYAFTVSRTFRTIFRQITFQGKLRICQLDVVSEHDKQMMLTWNPKEPFATMQEACMHHLVEGRAREIPGSQAVCAWDGSLTYSQLDALSSIAARRLACLGIGPGVYVPFAFEKSKWAVVASLAILKAGGAFVPLNPRDPPARLTEILRNVNAVVIVTTEAFVATFESLVKHVEVISADTIHQRPIIEESSSDNEANGLNSSHIKTVSPKDPIFVLFTSGSTGKPKGMIHDHAAICTHAMTHGEAMGYHGARVLQFAAHTFDVAIIDIFTTLTFGGCVCIPSEDDRRNNIIEVINNMRVDFAILTPSFAGLLEPSEVPTLKTLAVGGEALPQDRIERWAEKARFIQIYGPAEVGICLTKVMSPSTAPEEVGRPLPNCSCWLVDPDDTDSLVPIGAVGEMIIAGPTLAHGYLNDNAKTELSFINAPTWAVRMGLQFQRFYKTGDLLRYDVDSLDGSYRFVGRKDAQIKLHGQRIEPGEVEYHLGRLPNVAVSMVTRPDEGCFAGELVAVVQMQRSNSRSKVRDEPVSLAPLQSLPIEMVREYLSKILPGYMVPTVCLVISSMPFVPSLKIDRRQVSTWLMAMDSRPSEVNMTVCARLGPDEITANGLSIEVAQLLAANGKVRRFMFEGRDFAIQDAGIDSIQIISLLMSIQRQYQRKIPVNVLLSSKTTIRTLAHLIDDNREPSLNGHILSEFITSQATAVDMCHESKVSTEVLFRNIGVQDVNKNGRLSGPCRNVFLTGATGYLGSAILHQLLETPNIDVCALVRCSVKSRGLQRIKDAAILYGWWRDEYISRIHVWQGDLTKTSLGLGTAELESLHGRNVPRDLSIHAIIHNGAKVHYSSDYETLKAVNVLSTLELLQITAGATHISTLVYVSGGGKPNINASDDSSASLGHLSDASGYTQTKFVSEQLVRNCVDHAAFQTKLLRVVKPGYIIGSIRNGIANQSDFIWRLVAGCVEIAAYNGDEAEHWLFVADVDRVAHSVITAVFDEDNAREKHLSGNADGVLDGIRFSELWDVVADVYDTAFEALGQDEWMNRLRDKVLESGDVHLLFPLLHVLERDGGCLGEKASPMAATAGVKEAVEQNLRHLIGAGFLPIPKAKMDRQ